MHRTILYSFIAIMLGTYGIAGAQSQQKLNIEKATVFIKGAELLSTTKVGLAKGENEFLFTNVAGDVNNQSIVVNATNGVVVESVTFQNNYTNTDNVSPKVKSIKDSIEQMNMRKAPISNKIATLNEQILILQTNRKVSGDNTGLSTAELLKLLELTGAKMEGYLNQKNKEEAGLKKIDDRIAGLTQQLQEEQQKEYQPGGQLLVKLFARESTSSDLTITYVVPNAGWSPTYDIWADDAKGPVKFYYKASIYQNSGVKWNNIRLTLSTGNPQEGMQAPVLTPWYVALQYKVVSRTQTADLVALTPGIYQGKRGASPSSDGGRTSGNLYIIDGVQVQGRTGIDMAQGATQQMQVVDVNTQGVNTTFDIELPYTIPNDGQEHMVAVKRYETPAAYEYYAAPKADKDAFLIAKIANWEDLNLLPGRTNIFYEGTYVGQGFLDPHNIKDSMRISLGRDKKIVVKRERDKKLHSVKMIGTNVREAYAYNITVRNTRKEPITISVNDQLPISNDKDIVIEDVEIDGADKEEATGMLKWAITLKGNETKTVRLGYTLKYPRGKVLQ